uniref:Uncharacterized protein n=1 Tax=Parascaris univalens TaxID=6257 RepID=A0A915BXX0_PARUN
MAMSAQGISQPLTIDTIFYVRLTSLMMHPTIDVYHCKNTNALSQRVPTTISTWTLLGLKYV